MSALVFVRVREGLVFLAGLQKDYRALLVALFVIRVDHLLLWIHLPIALHFRQQGRGQPRRKHQNHRVL